MFPTASRLLRSSRTALLALALAVVSLQACAQTYSPPGYGTPQAYAPQPPPPSPVGTPPPSGQYLAPPQL